MKEFIRNNKVLLISFMILFISVLALISKILIEITSKRKIDLAI